MSCNVCPQIVDNCAIRSQMELQTVFPTDLARNRQSGLYRVRGRLSFSCFGNRVIPNTFLSKGCASKKRRNSGMRRGGASAGGTTVCAISPRVDIVLADSAEKAARSKSESKPSDA